MDRLVRGLRGFGAFWWDVVVGGDWQVAIGVVVALAVTALLVDLKAPAWWFLPIAVLMLLGLSLARGAHDVGRS